MLDSGSGAISRASAGQNGAGFGTGGSFHGDYGAGGDFRLLLNGCFNVFGVEVDARSRDDDFTFAAEEAQLARLLALGDVAGGEPLLFAREQRSAMPGSAGNDRAADHDFAVWSELDLAPRERLADAPSAT